jgi:hypothetical protein
MATHIPVITQEELDPNPPEPEQATMAQTNSTSSITTKINSLASLALSPRTPMKRFVQRTLDGKVSTHRPTKAVNVRPHKRKSPSAKAHHCTSKEKSIKAKDDYKASRALAITLHIDEVRNLMNRK